MKSETLSKFPKELQDKIIELESKQINGYDLIPYREIIKWSNLNKISLKPNITLKYGLGKRLTFD
jgi:hypothetical protein